MGILSSVGFANLRDSLLKKCPIREPRQRIVESQSMRLPLGFLAFGDIVKGSHIVLDDAGFSINRGDRQPFRIRLSIFSEIPYFTLP